MTVLQAHPFGKRSLYLVAALLIAPMCAGVPLVLAAPPPAASSKAAAKTDLDALAAAAKQSQMLFTATIQKVETIGSDKGTPPTLSLSITFKPDQTLKGPNPEAEHMLSIFTYTTVEGRDFIPEAGQTVLIAGDGTLAHPIIGGPPSLPGHPITPVEIKLRPRFICAANTPNLQAAITAIAKSIDPQAAFLALAPSADLVFVATVAQIHELPPGTAAPPATLAQLTLQSPTMLKGEPPRVLECPYTFVKDADFLPRAGEKVLAVAENARAEDSLPPNSVSGRHSGPLPTLGGSGPRILALLSATDKNIAAVKEALASSAGPATAPSSSEKP